ncbi:nucleoside deaminase [bacterium]|nr:nucleoside deaminase [bacterium]
MTPDLTEQFMLAALSLAEEARVLDEVPIGAVLVHEGRVIGKGHNLRETSGRTTAHAEIQALEDYNQRTKEWRLPAGTSLFVTIEPCMMCTGALLWARLDNLYFGAPDPKGAGLSLFTNLIQQGLFDHKLSEMQGGVLRESCSGLLSSYFKNKRSRRAAKP